MPRFLRLTLWSLGLLAILLGGAVLWIESQLRPEPLGLRVQGLLADAKIKGEITRIEASLDGTFSAEGIRLTLADGTIVGATSIKGEARLWSILTGTYALRRLEIDGLDVDLSHPVKKLPAANLPAPAAPALHLPQLQLGPYSISGRTRLVDGTLLRFNIKGASFDTAGAVDLRAGVAWPGFKVGKVETDPRGEIILKANFRRPLGEQGLALKELCEDLASIDLQLAAKDNSSVAAGRMALTAKGGRGHPVNPTTSPPTAVAAANKGGLVIDIDVTDTAGRTAVKAHAMHIGEGLFTWATLDLDPTQFGILSQQLPDCQVTGRISGGNAGSAQGAWNFNTAPSGLNVTWKYLAKQSKTLPRTASSAWNIVFGVAQTPTGFTVGRCLVKGNGIELSAQPFDSPAGGLPADLSVNLKAQNANLIALAPFLKLLDLTPIAGTWSGEATLSLVKGEPTITTIQPHEIKGLTLESRGKLLLQGIDASFPLKSEAGAFQVGPFAVNSAAGNIARGELTFRPNKNGGWQASAQVNLGIAELTSQPGWEDLPREKLAGLRVAARASASAEAGQAPVITATTAQISRAGADLLTVKLRQPYSLGGPRPTGVLVEASAAQLPLESLAALIPGLKVSGNLNRAELVAGFNAQGLFVRTEGAPLSFAGTSVAWNGQSWVRECDLTAELDLSIGDPFSVLSFNKAKLTSRGRLLAQGDISLGLGGAPTTLRLEGDLGGLASQPFAGPLGVVDGGNYQAAASRQATGEISVQLTVSDVGLKLSAGRIKEAKVTGKYAPSAQGLETEGTFRLVATNLSSGKFSLTQANRGATTDWQGAITVDTIDLDDILGLIPKSAEETPARPVAAPKPDRISFWHQQTGAVQLNIGQAKGYGVRAEKIVVRAEAEAGGLRLTQVSGKVAEGTLSGRGLLAFRPTTTGGPYVLNATLALNQFELGGVLKGFPSVQEFIQGQADVTATANSVCGTPGELVAKLQVDTVLNSKGGRVRAFGNKEGGTAAMLNKAGDLGETLGGLALIAGAFGKNPEKNNQFTKVGAALSAAGKLQKALADFSYQSADLKISRLASGTLKFEKIEIRNTLLSLQANGGINMTPGAGFTDWPMLVNAQLRGAGEFAEYFNVLGFSSGSLQSDGMTEGPAVNITGSLNNVRSDLMEKLDAAVGRVRSAGAYREGNPTVGNTVPSPPQPAPAAPKKRPGLSDLLKELGR